MDASPREKLARNSRWTRDPVVDHNGNPTAACLTERDIEIVKLLARYRYLPADTIHAFVGGNFKHLVHRLGLLSRKPNLYIHRPVQQRRHAAANYRHLIYELDDRGRAHLQERGISITKKHQHNFEHELMVCQIMASIELGVRADPSVRLITWQEIMESGKLPEATRASPKPTHIPVSFSFPGRQYSTHICADGLPFGLERTHNGQRSYLFFPGIEADCGSEPILTSDLERSSIDKKFAAYRAIAEQGIYRSHFGFPNFFVPFVTTTESRMQSMMKLLERITEGRGSKMFLFKKLCTFTSVEAPTRGIADVLSEAWQRVGFEPFSFTK